mmetsp:Transcript_16338/g.2693  ORF Transcript_16338/g.2693 Transcript_16338/m.2693 type:complete len:141 (+) Transcript_16338:358-780(+)
MWLAPFVNSTTFYGPLANAGAVSPNEVAIIFDSQICVSMIKFYNYSKNPERGVKEFEISMDDIILYRGVMKQADGSSDWSCSVLFTGDRNLVGREQGNVFNYIGQLTHNIILYNENRLEGGNIDAYQLETERPHTSVILP